MLFADAKLNASGVTYQKIEASAALQVISARIFKSAHNFSLTTLIAKTLVLHQPRRFLLWELNKTSKAYNPPMANNKPTPTFCLSGSRTSARIKHGRIRMARSVAEFALPFAIIVGMRSMQEPYIILISHAFAIGWQRHKNSKDPRRQYTTTVAIMMKITFWIRGFGASLLRNRSIESFVNIVARP